MSDSRWTRGGADEDWVYPPAQGPGGLGAFRASGAATAKRIVDGMNLVEMLDAIQLRAALDRLDVDQHDFGSRPCGTCREVSHLIGRDFGCVRVAKRRAAQLAARDEARKQAAP